eukprot:2157479-Amphidinium_carterae.1
MTSVDQFLIGDNSFTGMLPVESGHRLVTGFCIEHNSFAGSLPDGGMRAMRALEYLDAFENRLAGMLPEGLDRGEQALAADSPGTAEPPNVWEVPSHFPRMLPAALSHLAVFTLDLSRNCFEGSAIELQEQPQKTSRDRTHSLARALCMPRKSSLNQVCSPKALFRPNTTKQFLTE